MSNKRLFCDGWEFAKMPIDTEYSPDFDWKEVDIPHDWLIYDCKNLYETSTGFYRRKFFYEKDGQRIFLRFDGVYMDSKLYVNGSKVGEWKYGYSTFEFEITDYLVSGENTIVVRVDHRSPNTRWYSGAGIFRKVTLIKRPAIHILADGVYVCAKKINGTDNWTVSADCYFSEQISGYKLSGEIRYLGKRVKEFETEINGSKSSAKIEITAPVIWDIDSPELYELEVKLQKDGMELDSETVRFGFREIEFTADKGFFLNGRHLKLHGCCEHHDLGALGAAFNRSIFADRLEKLRKMGINAIRTSHNMPAEEMLELCDEKGFLVICEGFDMWEKSKTTYDYARFFPEWAAKDVKSWVTRDRNHPCIIAWSIGNEIYDTHESERGLEITKMLYELVRKYDYMKHAYVTIGSNYMQWENAQKCGDFLGLAGYNYGERLYDEHHKNNPQRMIYGSETASVIHSRGIYHFPYSSQVLTNDDRQCSALDNCCTAWGARSTEACIIDDRDAEYCAGQFIWTGFDYIGEPTPYQTKNSYFGQIDTAGFPKDSYYIFKAAWTDYRKDPFVHIFPYWCFNEGDEIDVRVCTNAPAVELFRDGVSCGKVSIDHKHGKNVVANYLLDYKKGEISALAYDEYGNVIASQTRRSFGEAARIVAKADREVLKADGEDMTRVEIWTVDSEGNVVENANNRIFVEVSNGGRLMGLDNGDSTDYDEYKTSDRRLFSGKLLAYVASTDKTGEIKVTLSSKGLEGATLTLTAVEAEVREGVSFKQKVSGVLSEHAEEIPIRTVYLHAAAKEITPENPTVEVNYKLLPTNCTFSDVEFKTVTFRNIKSPIADCELKDGRLFVTAKGNGDFKLRALCKNGDNDCHIISELTMHASGFALTCFNPYELVLGGLYTVSGGAVTNAIERGAEFADRNFAYIGFENVDFGEFGSDTVSVPIFSNSNDPVNIYFYDGNPDKGGELLGKFEYNLSPIWLTYQAQEYTLSKRLSGIHDFYIASDFGYSLQGFSFVRQEKAFSVLYANQAENIYGDGYAVGDEAVTGIINNVSLELGEIDFSSKTPKTITICGRTPLAANSIHIQLKGEGENRILCEFIGGGDFNEQIFPLEVKEGKYTLAVTFLPGTKFDLKWIKFNS